MRAHKRVPSRRRVAIARAVAIAVDFAQIVVFPAFLPGAVSPFDDALDLATAVTMVSLVGWHWSFLPSFLSELVPYLDLVPTWTAAVFLATRKGPAAAPPPPGPPKGTIDTTLAAGTKPGGKPPVY